MKKLAIYEPALCCSTGVCGPSVDEDLLRITGVMKKIKEMDDVMMVRYNLAANPNSFVRNKLVTDQLEIDGPDCLPLTLVDDEIVKIGAYPSNKEISAYLGIQVVEETIQ